MSDKLILKFENKEIKVPKLKSLEECVASFQNNFPIDKKQVNNLFLFYSDEEKDDILVCNNEDYLDFINSGLNIEKTIYGEIEIKNQII